MKIIKYSKSEEFLNIITHLLGFVLSLIFFLPLVISTYKGGDIVAFLLSLIHI